MNNELMLKNIETKVRNKEITSKEELCNELLELKNRGILTQGQVNAKLEELSNYLSSNDETHSNKSITRTPQREYYENGSAGFSKTGFLVLTALSVPFLVAMLNLLSK